MGENSPTIDPFSVISPSIEQPLLQSNGGFFVNISTQLVPQVLLEIRDGHALGMAAAARLVPGVAGGTANASTVFRWATTGVKLPDGRKLKLESVRIGHRIVTSGPALERFILQTTESYNPAPTPAPRSPAARQRASDRAAKELERIGC